MILNCNSRSYKAQKKKKMGVNRIEESGENDMIY